MMLLSPKKNKWEDQMGRLDGRVAIVTGAAYGEKAMIGSEFAKALAAEGAQVFCSDVKDCGTGCRRYQSRRR